ARPPPPPSPRSGTASLCARRGSNVRNRRAEARARGRAREARGGSGGGGRGSATSDLRIFAALRRRPQAGYHPPPMRRRDLLRAGATLAALPASAAPASKPTPSDREYWTSVARRLALPVLENLANGTLRARMPVEEAEGAGRR